MPITSKSHVEFADADKKIAFPTTRVSLFALIRSTEHTCTCYGPIIQMDYPDRNPTPHHRKSFGHVEAWPYFENDAKSIYVIHCLLCVCLLHIFKRGSIARILSSAHGPDMTEILMKLGRKIASHPCIYMYLHALKILKAQAE